MIEAMMGGVVIGIAVSLMMLFNGRVTGISGIVAGVLRPVKGDVLWRTCFILGLLAGGVILSFIKPDSFEILSSAYVYDYAIAGLLVGFGTVMGSGCTSGHGVCGISRMSVRSIVSTLIFILFGILSVLIFKFLRGSL